IPGHRLSLQRAAPTLLCLLRKTHAHAPAFGRTDQARRFQRERLPGHERLSTFRTFSVTVPGIRNVGKRDPKWPCPQARQGMRYTEENGFAQHSEENRMKDRSSRVVYFSSKPANPFGKSSRQWLSARRARIF